MELLTKYSLTTRYGLESQLRSDYKTTALYDGIIESRKELEIYQLVNEQINPLLLDVIIAFNLYPELYLKQGVSDEQQR
jgi:hypothetical protein